MSLDGVKRPLAQVTITETWTITIREPEHLENIVEACPEDDKSETAMRRVLRDDPEFFLGDFKADQYPSVIADISVFR